MQFFTMLDTVKQKCACQWLNQVREKVGRIQYDFTFVSTWKLYWILEENTEAQLGSSEDLCSFLFDLLHNPPLQQPWTRVLHENLQYRLGKLCINNLKWVVCKLSETYGLCKTINKRTRQSITMLKKTFKHFMLNQIYLMVDILVIMFQKSMVSYFWRELLNINLKLVIHLSFYIVTQLKSFLCQGLQWNNFHYDHLWGMINCCNSY